MHLSKKDKIEQKSKTFIKNKSLFFDQSVKLKYNEVSSDQLKYYFT